MENRHAKKQSIVTLLLITVLISIASTSIFAQQPGRRIPERRETLGERLRRERAQRQMAELERRNLENLGKTPAPEKSPERLLYDQIREDYQQIQVVNNQMMHATFGSRTSAVDTKLVAKALGEINSRASRLRSNLKLPKSEDEEQKQPLLNSEISDIRQLKSSLLVLDGLVMSFIENPMFRNHGVIDLDQSAKARRDLKGIIELGSLIKQTADKLKD
jgi:hypothetical protein